MNRRQFLERHSGRLLPWLAVSLGALAWIAALGAVGLSLRSGGDATPVSGIAELPTLAAAVTTLTPTATNTPSPSPSATLTATVTVLPEPTPTSDAAGRAALAGESAASLPLDAGSTPSPQAVVRAEAGSACTPPPGWERYVVQPDDTLFAFVLGTEGAVTVDDLMAANCLSSRYLRVDQVIYLPPGAAENAPPSVPAGPASDLGGRGPRTPHCPCTIVVREGWRREQIAEAINAAQTLFTGGDFLAVTGSDATVPFDFAMERPSGTSLEGFFFPGTYTVQDDTTAEQFRDMLLGAFAANVTPQMRADAAAQGVSFYQALIVASIVQRESRAPEIQPLIASVIYNRLRDGSRLAQTVTVQYALGRAGNWWPRVTGSGLEVDSPYNSYTRRGLPPTPIDSPGLSAIRAAVYPAQTEYRYHTAACGGGVAFAVTYEEFLSYVNCP
ncbi:MAG: endolytic transglycosylase MltG [Aggregatilineaceae bacterium]